MFVRRVLLLVVALGCTGAVAQPRLPAVGPVAGSVVAAGTGPSSGPASRPVGPFEEMERLYKPLTVDDTGWALKVESMSGSEEAFARGGRDLFFVWARGACADWARDYRNLTWCHGDARLENAGVYVADVGSAHLAVGLTGFDDAYVGPFQVDVLQAVVSLRMSAVRAGLAVSPGRGSQVVRDVASAFRQGLRSGRTATEAYGDDPRVRDLLLPGDATLRDAAERDTEEGHFSREVRGRRGELTDAYSELGAGRGSVSRALVGACEGSASLARLVKFADARGWDAAIDDVALRRQIGPLGSDGMIQIVARTRGGAKIAGGPSDATFVFRAEGPAPAERAGFVPMRILEGGRRVLEGTRALTSPERDAIGWCAMSGVTFAVEVRTPWDRPVFEGGAVGALKTDADLEWASRFLGCLLGAAHASAVGTREDSLALADRLDAEAEGQIDARATAYIAANRAAFEAWDRDARVADLRAAAQAYMRDPAGK